MDDIQNTVKNLHPLEVRVLLSYTQGDELTAEKIEKDLNLKSGNGNQALSWLAGKGIVSELRRETKFFFELTGLGREWKERGTPEERLIEYVRIKPGQKLPEIAGVLGLDNKDMGSAFGSLSKLGALTMDGSKGLIMPEQELVKGRPGGRAAEHLTLIRGLLERAAEFEAAGRLLDHEGLSEAERLAMGSLAKKRAAAAAPFREIDRETVVFGFTGSTPETGRDTLAAALKAAGITGEETGALTPAMLASGSWRGKTFRSYNIKVPPTRLIPGRTNPYAKFLEDVKDKLASLGFEEFDGPLVETEFWNSDALFMPQFHSARDIHDVYRVAGNASPGRGGEAQGAASAKGAPAYARIIEEPWLSNVAAAHESGGATGSRGWGYGFDREFTRALILRSQGTVLSAKTLPHAKIPGKYFGIVRCFRYDRVDATHLPDFYQTEGIVLGEDVNLKTLLGMLEMFALEVAGAKEVKYVPGYFPFTEPSVEVHIKHPVLGWFELGGSGIFRPEVTESLGVHVPVAAWGIGIDRMALMALGLNDLRELFSCDIENVRLRRTKAAAV
ncbi:MAG: phenylalanine--tRNA ligase subunit alpha [Spirochaetaceae bacterium]|jgi:phenylalanyl-tRNA synthetase alpha chain|nr:phenylalanine--tRNA ligase subunit alpha [Spirochaetaceae bacterium]